MVETEENIVETVHKMEGRHQQITLKEKTNRETLTD